MAVATRLADQARGYFVGTYAGTTAAQNIHIGFEPALIIGVNVTDGDTMYIWSTEDLANVVSIIATPATVAEAITQVDNGTVIGFALPASGSTTNEDGKTYVFLALPE